MKFDHLLLLLCIKNVRPGRFLSQAATQSNTIDLQEIELTLG